MKNWIITVLGSSLLLSPTKYTSNWTVRVVAPVIEQSRHISVFSRTTALENGKAILAKTKLILLLLITFVIPGTAFTILVSTLVFLDHMVLQEFGAWCSKTSLERPRKYSKLTQWVNVGPVRNLKKLSSKEKVRPSLSKSDTRLSYNLHFNPFPKSWKGPSKNKFLSHAFVLLRKTLQFQNQIHL